MMTRQSAVDYENLNSSFNNHTITHHTITNHKYMVCCGMIVTHGLFFLGGIVAGLFISDLECFTPGSESM
jgi:hypothetical protein